MDKIHISHSVGAEKAHAQAETRQLNREHQARCSGTHCRLLPDFGFRTGKIAFRIRTVRCGVQAGTAVELKVGSEVLGCVITSKEQLDHEICGKLNDER